MIISPFNMSDYNSSNTRPVMTRFMTPEYLISNLEAGITVALTAVSHIE